MSCPPDGQREDSLVIEGKRGVCQKWQTPNKARWERDCGEIPSRANELKPATQTELRKELLGPESERMQDFTLGDPQKEPREPAGPGTSGRHPAETLAGRSEPWRPRHNVHPPRAPQQAHRPGRRGPEPHQGPGREGLPVAPQEDSSSEGKGPAEPAVSWTTGVGSAMCFSSLSEGSNISTKHTRRCYHNETLSWRRKAVPSLFPIAATSPSSAH